MPSKPTAVPSPAGSKAPLNFLSTTAQELQDEQGRELIHCRDGHCPRPTALPSSSGRRSMPRPPCSRCRIQLENILLAPPPEERPVARQQLCRH